MKARFRHAAHSFAPVTTAFAASTPVHFALFGPLHYEPNYAYPLLVWLHGSAANEAQLNDVMPHISLRNYVGVAPRGTIEQGRCCHWQDSADQHELAEQRILNCIELAQQKYNIAPQRVFLAGLEAGGTFALRMALRYPRQFGGAISIDGAFPRFQQPLAALQAARQMPLLMITNQASLRYTEQDVCDDLRLWHAANLRVMLRQYPNDTGVTDLMLSDLDRWVMNRVTGMADTEMSDALPSAV